MDEKQKRKKIAERHRGKLPAYSGKVDELFLQRFELACVIFARWSQ